MKGIKKLKSKPAAWWIVVVLTILYIAFLAAFSIRRHRAFATHGFDLGNVDQAVWNTLHGRFLRMTNEEGTKSRMGTHCDPILALLAPLYLIYSGPESLLLVQTLALALGAWPIFWLAKEKLQSDWAAVALAGLYLSLPAVEAANLFEFHALTLGASFLLWAFYSLHRDRDASFVLFSVLAMSCKEDLPLFVSLMGIYAILFHRKRRLGAAMTLLGAAYFVVAMKIVIPHFNEFGRSIQFQRYSHLGASIEEVFLTVVTRPGHTLQTLTQDPLKMAYLLRLLFPVGYLSLLGPQILLLASPSLGLNLLSTYPPMYSLDMFHYSVAIMPFVILAAIWGIALLARVAHRWLKVEKRFVIGVLIVYVLILGGFYHRRLGYSPLAQNYRWPQISDHHRMGWQLARSIPQDAIVSSQNHLNPHVSQRETGYIFPNIHDAEYVFVDVSGPIDIPLDYKEYHGAVKTILADERFGVLQAQDGYIILQRGVERAALGPEFYDFVLADDLAASASSVTVDFGSDVQLVGLQSSVRRGNILTLHSYWRGSGDRDNLGLFICLVDEDGHPFSATIRELRASIWYPPDRWHPEQLVSDKASIQLPADVDLSRVSLGLFVGPPAATEEPGLRKPPVIREPGTVQIEAGPGILLVPLW